MQEIQYKNQKIRMDEEGYMLDSDAWSRDLGEHIADLNGVRMTPEHWWVVDYIRAYYKENQFLPNIRVVVNELRRQGFKDRARDKYLFQLFPNTPIRTACRIGGLHKPPPGFVCL